jgi:hypothetical protein
VACQRELKNERSEIKAAQNEFEETVRNMLHRQFKGIMSVVQQQAQSLSEVSSELQVTAVHRCNMTTCSVKEN